MPSTHFHKLPVADEDCIEDLSWQAPSDTIGRLRRGDQVVVRSARDILATLDTNGACEGLMFMPEMIPMIGNSFRVHRRAERTCVEGAGIRRMRNAVFLETARCDGAAHQGCQRECLIFWHEAWLRPANQSPASGNETIDTLAVHALRMRSTKAATKLDCQSTRLSATTEPLTGVHFGALLRGLKDADITTSGFIGIVTRSMVNRLRKLLALPPMGMIKGTSGKKSRGELGLSAGEWVRIKDQDSIRATLDANGRNLGLSFEPEMTGLVGQVRRVEAVIERIIDERTGRMIKLSNTVKLQGTYCEGLCSKLCPRANPLFWREAWLERTDAPHGQTDL